MKTRRFRGKDLRETLDKVRAALGDDAIIVSTRKVSRNGREFGQGFGSNVEVEATTPELEFSYTAAFRDVTPGELDNDMEEIPESLGGELPLDDSAPPVPEYADLYFELSESGLGEETAKEILSRAEKDLDASGYDAVEAGREQVMNILSQLFDVKNGVRMRQPGEEGPAISNFIGPAGAGKTTTIAKIAALCKKRRLKVGLITLDTRRAGGAEQMEKLADLLRVPFLAVNSRQQLDQALAKFKRADVILVDSPGRSTGDEAAMADLEVLFGEDRPGENYLVLAANTNSEDMKRIGEKFSRVPLKGLIFTKLDETSRFGVIFEVHLDLGVPVAYLTSGLRIPGDIDMATPNMLARLILPAAQELVSAQGAIA
jgi:flagellar biosynthesis protein FlhF